VDTECLAHHLRKHHDMDLGPGLTAHLIAGGKSNLTYRLRSERGDFVLRRPPLGHVLATAHDMSREYQVMSALGTSCVPVPDMHLMCVHREVLGAPFYLMEHVEGTPYRNAEDLAPLGEERTRTISTGMIDTLAALHGVRPSDVGLAEFGRPHGFLERQVRRWGKQLDASSSRPLPGVNVLRRRLEAGVPTAHELGIVHGDYRLDNLLVDDTDAVAAVIDWEMATVGDVLTDLALLLVYHKMAQFDAGPVVADASNAAGFLSIDDLLERYTRSRGQPLPPLHFHLGLAYFKLAVVLEGIHFRFISGLTVGDDYADIGGLVEPLIDEGLHAMRRKT